MVRLDCGTQASRVDITNTVSADSSTSYYIGADEYYKRQFYKKKETKKEKRDRVSLERNRKSWVSYNEPKPNIRQVFKPVHLPR